ncbi:MAG: hypothetical protein AABY18_07940 [Candidatus Thermoplasmatota archaeon]
MKNSTVSNLLFVCIFLDLALIGVVVYDYFQNDSDWIVGVLAVFGVFVVITAILFFLAGRRESTETERVVVRVVDHEAQSESAPMMAQPLGDVLPPIPPAPLRSTHYVAPVPPRRPAALARTVTAEGPFKFNGYTLHKKDVKLANGNGNRTIYFFSKKKPKSGKPCAKPAGYHVGVNERTGLPFLKKGAGRDGEDLTPQAEHAYRPQCSAVTADGAQCRNSARQGSKYCAPHFGYQPPTTTGLAKRIEGEDWSDDDRQTDSGTVRDADTKARVTKAKDTKPSVRRNWFGRRKAAA